MSTLFRLHVVALPHTQTTTEHNSCAYSSKILNFCNMMHARGHTVFHYGAEGSNPDCTEHVSIISTNEQEKYFGGHDWKKKMYRLQWDANEPYWKITNHRAVAEITVRQQPRDIVCVVGGLCQKPISDGLDHSIVHVVEPFIGYTGVFSRFQVFESYTHMHHLAGQQNPNGDGDFYKAVIPVYLDPANFPLVETKADYLLYLGRLIQRKGLRIAEQVARDTGRTLKIAGQGMVAWTQSPDGIGGRLVAEDGEVYEGPHIEYVGFADMQKRAELMGNAHAVMMPTTYYEPGGNVAVEAQACGTPIITTDFGCFAETVEHGLSGYRCHSHSEFCWAVDNATSLKPRKIRERVKRVYSLDATALKFEHYFGLIDDLWAGGWYEPHPERTELDWLRH